MAKKLKSMTDEFESITITDFLVSRFQSTNQILRFISATALSLFVVIYVSAQIDITGKTFESFLNLNYYLGIGIGFGIVVVYIFSGGFIAVAVSDLFQGILMFLGLIILPIVTYFTISVDNGILDVLRSVDPALVNIWGDGGFNAINIASVIGFLSIGIGFMGSPQVYVRFIAIKNEQEIEKGKWVALWFTFLTDSSAVIIGMLGRYLFTQIGDNPESILGNAGEDVLSLVLGHVMPTFIVGIYIAVVLSAVMSTVDSLLVLASSAVTRDFYQKIINPDIDQDSLVKLSKLITLILAILALGVSIVISIISPTRTVFWFVIFGWSGIAATFCPVIILSIFWKGITEWGAISSMVTGFLCVPFFKFVVPKFPHMGPYIQNLDVMFPSVFFAILMGFVFSIYQKRLG